MPPPREIQRLYQREEVLSSQKQQLSIPQGFREVSNVSAPTKPVSHVSAPADAVVQSLHFIDKKQLRPKRGRFLAKGTYMTV